MKKSSLSLFSNLLLKRRLESIESEARVKYVSSILAFVLVASYGCIPASDNRITFEQRDCFQSINMREISNCSYLHMKSDIVFLGENHNNPSHHEHQAQIINDMVAAGKTPSVVMEMVSEDQVSDLTTYRNGPRKKAEDLRQVLKWDETGWPALKIYAPVFQAILDHDLTLRHGAPSDKVLAEWRSGHYASDDISPYEELRQKFGPEQASAVMTSWRDQTFESHCRLMAKDDLNYATQQQLYRDRYMARQVQAAVGCRSRIRRVNCRKFSYTRRSGRAAIS